MKFTTEPASIKAAQQSTLKMAEVCLTDKVECSSNLCRTACHRARVIDSRASDDRFPKKAAHFRSGEHIRPGRTDWLSWSQLNKPDSNELITTDRPGTPITFAVVAHGGVNEPNGTSLNDSHSNSSDSPLDSPASQQHQSHQQQQQQLHLHTGKTPSVQQTCSQLIKEGVKLLIQSKRKHSGGDSSDGNESSTPKAKVARRRDASMTDHRETSEDDIESKASPRSTVAVSVALRVDHISCRKL
uniref:Uncharacterized protein n=1 Tax=Anopheles maculatus TaxID=74869 RepID=A0A182T5F8_9DIPT